MTIPSTQIELTCPSGHRQMARVGLPADDPRVKTLCGLLDGTSPFYDAMTEGQPLAPQVIRRGICKMCGGSIRAQVIP